MLSHSCSLQDVISCYSDHGGHMVKNTLVNLSP